MRRGLRLVPAALLLTAVAEVVVFVLIGRWVGFGWAILLVAAASLSGMVLLRREGLRAWRGFRVAVDTGTPPGERASDGLVGLVAGLLLALPGLVTGAAGLLLASPPVRRLARRTIQRVTERRVSAAVAGDLFGPRRVRVRRGTPTSADRQPPVDVPPQFPGADAGPTIEGEIVEPPPQR